MKREHISKLEYYMLLRLKETNELYIVSHYWSEDTDPMAYKVTLHKETTHNFYPWESKGEHYYSSDLLSLINEGEFEVQH